MMTNQEPNSVSISAVLQLLGYGSDEVGDRYLVVAVAGKDPIPVGVSRVGKEPFFSLLNGAGASFYKRSTRDAVLDAIEKLPTDINFDVSPHLGFHRKRAFVFPGAVIGQANRQLVSALGHLDASILAKYRQSGTLETWQSK